MASPLILTMVIPSEKEMAPVKMRAVISPTENPATAMQFSTAPLFCTNDVQKSYDWCCGTALVSTMRMGIQLFISMRIQIRIRSQGAKPIQIRVDPDPGQTL